MAMRDIQQWEAVKTTALTASGGATPSVTGELCVFTQVDSNFSLFLENSGSSTSLSVTYQIGYMADGVSEDNVMRDNDLISWLTPADGGAVADMTTVDCSGSAIHASLTIAVGKWYRFIITNNDAGNSADSVRLSIAAQF